MTDRPARAALWTALAAPRRNAAAVLVVAVTLATTAVAAPPPWARYAAYLFVFCVWMTWFVLTTVDWIREAEF